MSISGWATFSSTTGVDNFTGGSANDTFIADNTGATSTFGAADTLAGGAGTDSLTIYGTNTTTVAGMSGIENATVDSMADTAAWNFASINGITSLTNSRAVGASKSLLNEDLTSGCSFVWIAIINAKINREV